MTSELFTPLTEAEVPDENEASVSAKFNVVMRRRKAGAAKPASCPGAPTTAELPKHAVSHWPYPLRHRQKQAAQNRQGPSEEHTSTECRLLLQRWRIGSP